MLNMHNISNFTAYSSLFTITTVSPNQHSHDEPWYFWLLIILPAVLIMCIVTGNLMVLYCLFTIRELQTVTGIFLTNLAVTDLGVGLVILPMALASITQRELLHRRWFCIIQGMANILFVIASLLTLSMLSLSKYINIGYSVQKRFKKKHAKYTIGGIWFITAIFAIAPAFGLSKFIHRTGAHQCAPHDDSLQGYIYAILALIIGIILPSVTMLYCYCKLYMLTHSHIRRMRVSDDTNASNLHRRLTSVESNMIHTLIMMVLAVFFCWLPTLILYFLSFAGILVSTTIDTICLCCIYGNSAVNPIIYAMRQKDFQRGFRQIIGRVCRLQLDRQ